MLGKKSMYSLETVLNSLTHANNAHRVVFNGEGTGRSRRLLHFIIQVRCLGNNDGIFGVTAEKRLRVGGDIQSRLKSEHFEG